MKLATVEYTGRVRNQRHRSVTGTVYQFNGDALEVERVDDLREFERKPNFAVERTPFGKMAELIEDESEDVTEKLEELGYNAKQKLAKHFDIKANQSEEDLTNELSDMAEELKKQMETY